MGVQDQGQGPPPMKPSPVEHLAPTSFPSMFSQPPPTTVPTMPQTLPTTNHSKTARQEQLIKKLVGMLPGSDEETIKNCITALRHRHGKLSGSRIPHSRPFYNNPFPLQSWVWTSNIQCPFLSGWPTSKIASHIADLIKEGALNEWGVECGEVTVVQGSLFFHLRGRWGRESNRKVWHVGKVFKNWCLEIQFSIIYPPNFWKKCWILINFCKKCPGRYLKVMKEWRSLG